ncbi:hypothetical protein K469DRAFT_5217 [Zopfia rhizophila CBS 207.26]|uniref:Uncharacterized protein n=1 Tax=Zopfia rhizophila CBS 207.26 TaxID=1314779 RepID=A0A6A6EWN6_9PEZI|nr:hypothetical protein K469DRAFT_5217 [Zopfia rhizophila CBS 207.26]
MFLQSVCLVFLASNFDFLRLGFLSLCQMDLALTKCAMLCIRLGTQRTCVTSRSQEIVSISCIWCHPCSMFTQRRVLHSWVEVAIMCLFPPDSEKVILRHAKPPRACHSAPSLSHLNENKNTCLQFCSC